MTDAPTTERLWSVTTLLSNGIPKDALVGWAAKITAENAVKKRGVWLPMAEEDEQGAIDWLKKSRYRKSGQAADRGTGLHEIMEKLALGLDPTPDLLQASPHVRHVVRFFEEHEPEFELSEATAYNLTYRYAGTLDGIVVFKKGPLAGGRYLIDMKTTDKSVTDRVKPPYGDVALQLVAYRNSEVVGLNPAQMGYQDKRRYYLWSPEFPHEPMPEVDGTVALAIFPDGYRLHPIETGEDAWRSFLAAREVARWVLSDSKHAVAPPVNNLNMKEKP